MFIAPFDGFIESFAGTAGPEDELVTFRLPLLEVFDERSVRFAELRPGTEAEGTVEINGDCFEIVGITQTVHTDGTSFQRVAFNLGIWFLFETEYVLYGTVEIFCHKDGVSE